MRFVFSSFHLDFLYFIVKDNALFILTKIIFWIINNIYIILKRSNTKISIKKFIIFAFCFAIKNTKK